MFFCNSPFYRPRCGEECFLKESYGQFLHVFFTFGIGNAVKVQKDERHFSFAGEPEQTGVILNGNSAGIFP